MCPSDGKQLNYHSLYQKKESYRTGCSFLLGDGGIEALMPRKGGCVLHHLGLPNFKWINYVLLYCT